MKATFATIILILALLPSLAFGQGENQSWHKPLVKFLKELHDQDVAKRVCQIQIMVWPKSKSDQLNRQGRNAFLEVMAGTSAHEKEKVRFVTGKLFKLGMSNGGEAGYYAMMEGLFRACNTLQLHQPKEAEIEKDLADINKGLSK